MDTQAMKTVYFKEGNETRNWKRFRSFNKLFDTSFSFLSLSVQVASQLSFSYLREGFAFQMVKRVFYSSFDSSGQTIEKIKRRLK